MPPHPVRILVVEDNATLRADVLDALRSAGFEAQVSTTLAMARVAAESHCDLILLDLILPDGEGLDLCRELRAAGRSIPIIMMTGMDKPEQRVAGLDAGADDYVVKPFHIPELIARVRSILRRTGKSGMGSFVKHLDLWIDADQVAAGRGTTTFKLKPREFDLLSFFIRHPGRAWTRQELLDQVWGHTFEGDARTVDLHVRRLRAKVEPNEESPHYLETVWGVGYRMTMKWPEDSDEIQPMPPPSTPVRREVSSGNPRSEEQEQGQ
ncbi:Alkaline phosphatase synthesis transcriptional regulatory protein SphR [Planctomycetes bacterium Poly30]|uniref:Phosphate regulon transcriptional regulatory protein PhoB n=1 Tax=Saltatorellus ferox TaxID=2528018 RepID=A0A518ENI2_9BACT|nr:Alkaline phosphatase synthesis transcriptional regulatory protein SphR [Planctomycetes bacterium Poly30]